MSLKKFTIGIMSLVLVFMFAGTAMAIEMKLGHYAPLDHPGDKAAKMFAANVEKRTNGEIKVTVYPNNQLGSPDQLLEQNIMGAIDMSLPTQGQLDKYSKKFAVVMMPFMYDGYEHAWKVVDGPFLEWAKPDIEKEGLVYLSNWEWGFRNVTNNVRAVNSPADSKGLKLRTPPELQLQVAMEAAGAVVTKIAFAELYNALKQGVVDGQENPLAVIYYKKLYEVQKHLSLTRHVYNNMIHVMSKKVWDKLTPEQQKIVKEESQKAGQFMRNTMKDQEADLLKNLKKVGMQVVETPDIKAFRAVMGPAYERIGEYAGKENVEKFIKMVEAAR